jgi:hypothetical protein
LILMIDLLGKKYKEKEMMNNGKCII